MQLSNECMDLLNKIFVIDELKRITLKGIREHAWYNKPLEAKYRDAFDRFQQEQGEKDHYTATRRLSEVCMTTCVHVRSGSWLARRDVFKQEQGVKDHYTATRRLSEVCLITCATSWPGSLPA